MMFGRLSICPEGKVKGPGQEGGQFLAQHGIRIMGVLCGAQFAQLKTAIVILTSQELRLNKD